MIYVQFTWAVKIILARNPWLVKCIIFLAGSSELIGEVVSLKWAHTKADQNWALLQFHPQFTPRLTVNFWRSVFPRVFKFKTKQINSADARARERSPRIFRQNKVGKRKLSVKSGFLCNWRMGWTAKKEAKFTTKKILPWFTVAGRSENSLQVFLGTLRADKSLTLSPTFQSRWVTLWFKYIFSQVSWVKIWNHNVKICSSVFESKLKPYSKLKFMSQIWCSCVKFEVLASSL